MHPRLFGRLGTLLHAVASRYSMGGATLICRVEAVGDRFKVAGNPALSVSPQLHAGAGCPHARLQPQRPLTPDTVARAC
jgi:hypothetical protein